jgi:hypothetical protein
MFERYWYISLYSIDYLPFQIFGKNDNHVPPEGRDLIRKTLHEKGVLFGFYEVAWAQRKLHTRFWDRGISTFT